LLNDTVLTAAAWVAPARTRSAVASAMRVGVWVMGSILCLSASIEINVEQGRA